MLKMGTRVERADPPGTEEEWQFTAGGQSLRAERGTAKIAIRALSERLVRVRVAPHGSFSPRRSWAVLPADEEFPGANATLREDPGEAELATSQVRVTIDRSDGTISVASLASGRQLLAHPAASSNTTPD